MKLTKNVLSIAVLSALSFSATTTATELDFYGKANVTIQSNDEGDGRYTEVKSNASRVGIKGSHKIDDNLSVVFKAEFEVDIDSDGDTFKDRNQYLGLKGSFGEILAGKNDTVLKQSQGKVDLFSDLNADIKKLWKGENRIENSITYKSPKFNNIQLGVTYLSQDDKETPNEGFSFSAVYGDKKLKKTDFFASIARDEDVKGYDTTRVTLQGKIGAVVVGGIYHQQESVSSGAELDGFMVSAKYKVNKVTYKAQVQTASEDGGDDTSAITLGADYKLSKQAKLFGYVTSFDLDTKEDKDYLAVGVEYKF